MLYSKPLKEKPLRRNRSDEAHAMELFTLVNTHKPKRKVCYATVKHFMDNRRVFDVLGNVTSREFDSFRRNGILAGIVCRHNDGME